MSFLRDDKPIYFAVQSVRKIIKLLKKLVKYKNTRFLTMNMTEVMVTRGGQITLTKDVREKLGIKEGDIILLNIEGDTALVSKKNPKIFETHDFLPENFEKTLRRMRTFSYTDRLKRQGII